MHSDLPNSAQPESLLRLAAVMTRVGLRKSAIYSAMRDNKFPPSVRIGRRAVCWPSSAIDAWIAERIANAQAS